MRIYIVISKEEAENYIDQAIETSISTCRTSNDGRVILKFNSLPKGLENKVIQDISEEIKKEEWNEELNIK